MNKLFNFNKIKNMKKLLFLLFGLFIVQCAASKVSELYNVYNKSDYLYWSDTKSLSWNDFQGEPLNSSNISSEIVVYNPATIEKSNLFSSFKLTSICVFDKKHSWVNRSIADSSTLLYNQTIFDIYELYTRKLRKKFSETDFGLSNYSEKFHQMTARNNKDLVDEVSKFRKESDIGKNLDAVFNWHLKIKSELKGLKQFNKETVE